MVSTIRQWFVTGAGSRNRARSPATSAAHVEAATNAVDRSERDAVSWYLDQAREFEKSKVDAAEEKARIADRRSVLSGGIALAAVFGLTALGILKRPNPPAVLRVNDTTGRVDVLPTTANGHVSFTEKTEKRRIDGWRLLGHTVTHDGYGSYQDTCFARHQSAGERGGAAAVADGIGVAETCGRCGSAKHTGFRRHTYTSNRHRTVTRATQAPLCSNTDLHPHSAR